MANPINQGCNYCIEGFSLFQNSKSSYEKEIPVISNHGLIGCSSYDASEDVSDLHVSGRVEAVLAMQGTEQRLAFDMLDKVTQMKVWKHSLDAKIASGGSLTNDQKKLILDLSSFVGQRSLPPQESIDNYRDSWLKKAKAVFSDKEIYSIAYTLKVGDGDGDTPAPSSCNCNRGAIFTCGSDPLRHCPDAPSNCKNPTSAGCSFLFLYECNQVCIRDVQ